MKILKESKVGDTKFTMWKHDDNVCVITDSPKEKIIESKSFNHYLNKVTGFSAVWGETKNDDPDFSPFGPLIFDVEISTICSQKCSFCYKSNTKDGTSMSLDTWKQIISKLPPTVGQIAFGIGGVQECKDLQPILWHTRKQDIVPNITINGSHLTEAWFQEFANVLGAIAISDYNRDNTLYCIDRLNYWKQKENATLQQINIHKVLSQNSINDCWELLHSFKENKDGQFDALNAIVFLSLKEKGNRNKDKSLRDFQAYKELIDFALDNNLPIGFDSCGCRNFIRAVQDRDNFQELQQVSEPCESGIGSGYLNVDGVFHFCSFCEGEDISPGIDMLEIDDFLTDVWYHPTTNQWRKKLLAKNRECLPFDLSME